MLCVALAAKRRPAHFSQAAEWVADALKYQIEQLEKRVLLTGSLAFASYLGGSAEDLGYSIQVDDQDNTWIAGITESTGLLGGGFDESHNGGFDAFVAKISANGTLAWTTYLGGSSDDFARDIAVDHAGNAWVTGDTYSSDFPANGFDSVKNGMTDAFVTKINANGTLGWSSCLGGSRDEEGNGIALDGVGNAWITGSTTSEDFPGGGFNSVADNSGDVFITKINANGTLAWGSFLGGLDLDIGQSVAIDGLGNAWITGATRSAGWAIRGFDTSYNGIVDAFVAKVNANGTLAWDSYLGGSGIDGSMGIAVDAAGNAWITGPTHSPDFPGGGFDSSYNDGNGDAFVAKVNANGTLSWGSFLGGTGTEYSYGIAVDSLGNAWVTGDTSSSNFPSGGFDSSFNGDQDGFVAKINANGSLAWGSYLGGSGLDRPRGIAVDGAGNAWVTGETDSTNFPVGSFGSSYNGGTRDAFFAVVTNKPVPPSAPSLDSSHDGGLLGDGVTNYSRPQLVGSGQVNTTIRLYDGATLFGQTNSDVTGSYTFQPTSNLTQGQHVITAVAVDGDGEVSAPSLPLLLVIDTTKPTAMASFSFDSDKQKLVYNFSEDLYAPPLVTDLTLQNLTTDAVIDPSNLTLDAVPNTGIVTYRFPGLSDGALPDGNYLAVLLASNATDIAGNHLSGPKLHQFFFLNGDANRDRKVTTIDFNLLAYNFGGSAKVFSQGDFNYDGNVSSIDFGILLAQYGKSQPAPGPLPMAAVASVFSGQSMAGRYSPFMMDGEDWWAVTG